MLVGTMRVPVEKTFDAFLKAELVGRQGGVLLDTLVWGNVGGCLVRGCIGG